MVIYRFEGPDGEGPYGLCRASSTYNNYTRLDDDCYNHPGPSNPQESHTPLDAVYRPLNSKARRQFFFGFSTKKAVKDWFPCGHGRRAMERRVHCKLYAVEVPDEHVFEGNRQVIFRRTEAVKWTELDAVTLRPVH